MKAVLIEGFRGRWVRRDRLDLEQHLKGLSGMQVTVVKPPRPRRQDVTAQRLHDVISSDPVTPLLIHYRGHGGATELGSWWEHGDGWGFGDRKTKLFYPYALLAGQIAARRGPTLVVNDCCYAAKLIQHLREAGASEDLVGIIAATSGGKVEFSWGTMTKRIVDAWRKGDPYELDHRERHYLGGAGRHDPLRIVGTGGTLMPLPRAQRHRVDVVREARWGRALDDLFMKAPAAALDRASGY